MSAEHMGMVFAAEGLDGSEKLLLLGYTNWTDPYGYCWPSEERLADDCGISRSTVQRSKRKLVQKKLLKSVRRTSKSGQPISNLSRVNLPKLSSMARTQRTYDDNLIDQITFDDDSQGDPESTLRGTPDHPETPSDLLTHHSDSYQESDRIVGRVRSNRGQSQTDSQSLTYPSVIPEEPLRPSVRKAEVARANSSDRDGRTDSSSVIEGQEQNAPAAGGSEEVTTVGRGAAAREVTSGELLLRRIGRSHPEIGAGLAQGTTLRDQSRVVDGLLLAGVTREEIRAVLVDRPYPEPTQRKRSMAALIAARLSQVCPPLDGGSLPVPAQAPASEAVSGPAPAVQLHLTRRPECPECGLDSPDGKLCAACQGWPVCVAGCGRRVQDGGLCHSCELAEGSDDSGDLGSCPGIDGQECGRPVVTAGPCPRCLTRAAAAKKTRDTEWIAMVAAAKARVAAEEGVQGAPGEVLSR
ncbi:helix-turn-helix domain-containing protein [Streptomyces sp. NPDC101175]|uniref:helix-turn-helix domain-containing protein n=1 Tax=Streptomyces sp. NPDC101175 TaxID=3366123 RepID=UPI003834587A